jgi:hypothetical protein
MQMDPYQVTCPQHLDARDDTSAPPSPMKSVGDARAPWPREAASDGNAKLEAAARLALRRPGKPRVVREHQGLAECARFRFPLPGISNTALAERQTDGLTD